MDLAAKLRKSPAEAKYSDADNIEDYCQEQKPLFADVFVDEGTHQHPEESSQIDERLDAVDLGRRIAAVIPKLAQKRGAFGVDKAEPLSRRQAADVLSTVFHALRANVVLLVEEESIEVARGSNR
jgi:hypothetical protein